MSWPVYNCRPTCMLHNIYTERTFCRTGAHMTSWLTDGLDILEIRPTNAYNSKSATMFCYVLDFLYCIFDPFFDCDVD